MKSQPLAVLLGGSGKTGRRVAARLAARGVPFRSVSRTSAPPFDWEHEDTWSAALRGATSLYLTYYPDLAMPGASEQIQRLSHLAVQCGVQHIVLLAGRGEPQVWQSERAVRESGASFTILRCAWFSQNFSESFLLGPVLEGNVAFPAARVREPFLDVDDVADVAVAALTQHRHAGQIYDLTGPRLLSFAEAVQEIAQASQRVLRYTPISHAAYAEALAHELPADQATALSELFAMLLDGHNELLTDGVERALGRKPRDFSDYAGDAALAGAWRV
jgi:uncharacterized protein YbjT (DUF2867 family)